MESQLGDKSALDGALDQVSDYSKHLIIAIMLAPFCAASLLIIIFLLESGLNPSTRLSSFQRVAVHPLFPVQVTAAAMLGYFLAPRISRPYYALRIWVLPSIVLAVAMLLWRPATVMNHDVGVWQHFFTWSTSELGNLERIACTMPFYCSILYGVGFAMRRSALKKAPA